MRVGYFVPWRGGLETGPFKKVAAQARAWEELGAEVALFVATSREAVDDWQELDRPGLVLAPVGGPISKLAERARLTRELIAWGPDVVYERHGLWAPALSRMARRVPTVIEVNGDDIREFRIHSRSKHVYNLATRGAHFRRAVGLVHVTEELAQSPAYAKFRLPSIVVGNGVDLSELPVLPASVDRQPGLVWLGDHRSPFQGLDDVLRLAAARPTWRFDIIGPRPRPGDVAPLNVTWHRGGPPSVYLPLLASADVGIGTLDAYRTGMQEASALKVREYLGCGLATVIGYQDTDFPRPVPHVLQVPNRPGGILADLPRLEAFVRHWHGRRVSRVAVDHLDVRVKETARVDFLRHLAGQGR